MERRDEKKAVLIALLQLAAPAIAQQILGTLLQYVDTAMVGHLGEAATAAVSTSTSVNWLVHSIPNAFAVGCLTLLSQSLGQGDRERMGRVSALAVRLCLAVSLLLTAVCLGVSPVLPIWMQTDPSIQSDAAAYFFLVSLSVPFFTAASFFGTALQAVKDTRTPMRVHLCCNVLNVGLNYLLIYTAGLGVRGAAIATSLSTALAGVWMARAFFRKEELRIPPGGLWKRDNKLLRAMGRISLPMLGTTFVSCMGYIVFARMVNGMGVTIFAAHSIAINAEEIFYLPGFGLRTASSTLIGIAVGEGDRRKFLDTRNTGLGVTVLLMALSGLLLYLLAEPLMWVFTNAENVVRMGAGLLRIVAFSEPFFGLMIAWEGVSYGTGRTRSVFWVSSGSMWGIRILFTWLCLHRWHLGIEAVWYCMVADNCFKALALTVCGLAGEKRGLGRTSA